MAQSDTLTAPAGIRRTFANREVDRISLSSECFVSVCQGNSSFKRLEKGWRILEQNCGKSARLFQTYDWVSRWSDQYSTHDGETQILIVTGYRRDKLVFVWPLMRTIKHGIRTLEWLSSPSGQYGDVLVHRDEASNLWLEQALLKLQSLGDSDILWLRHVRADSNFHPVAEENFFSGKSPERAPYMDLTQFKSQQEYDDRYNSQQRKRRKKIRQTLEKFGPVQFRVVVGDDETKTAIGLALNEKLRWLKQRGRFNRVLKCPKHKQFLNTLARAKAGDVETVVTEMTAGGRPVSWEIGFRVGKSHFAYITSHDRDLTDLSPGRLHMHFSQLKAIEDGMQSFDLMLPYDPHKESWSSGMIDTQDYYLPLTLRGKIQGHGYIKALRPLIQKLYYNMPQSILSMLQPLTSRLA